MTVHYSDDMVTLHHGDALDVARGIEAGSVQTIVTSPPYYGLRSYLDADHDDKAAELGTEASMGEYVDRMVALFSELRRVLADDGTVWLVIGDTYVGNAGGGRGRSSAEGRRAIRQAQVKPSGAVKFTLPEKNLLLVPARVALALQADGWILRKKIVWAKPNPMPEPVTDRPTSSHEEIYLFAKNARYYYDEADAA
jgi:site-specific DNA-methyltransferase (cytosine-N4-specific)